MGTLKGRLDALILCHGRYDMSSTNPRDFDKAYATNVRSCYNLISLCTPFLKVTKGCIVAISSQEAEIPSPSGMLNTVTKTMLNSLIQNILLLNSQGLKYFDPGLVLQQQLQLFFYLVLCKAVKPRLNQKAMSGCCRAARPVRPCA